MTSPVVSGHVTVVVVMVSGQSVPRDVINTSRDVTGQWCDVTGGQWSVRDRRSSACLLHSSGNHHSALSSCQHAPHSTGT